MAHPYSTIADLQQAVGGPDGLAECFDHNKDGVADVDVMNRAIESADAIIDAHANKQYLVPLDVVPTLIRDLSARIAVYLTREGRRMVDPETHGRASKTDQVLLDGIRDGTITLGVDPGPTKASARIDASLPRETTKAVSRAKLGGFS